MLTVCFDTTLLAIAFALLLIPTAGCCLNTDPYPYISFVSPRDYNSGSWKALESLIAYRTSALSLLHTIRCKTRCLQGRLGPLLRYDRSDECSIIPWSRY